MNPHIVTSTSIHEAILEGNVDVVRQELQSQKNVDKRDGKGKTPLHLAIEKNRPDLVKLLLECGANPNLGFEENDVLGGMVIRKPLYLAVSHSGFSSSLPDDICRSEEITSMLITYGADLHEKHFHFGLDWEAKEATLLHVAVNRLLPNMVALLISAGADVNATNAKGRPPLYICFNRRGVDTNGRIEQNLLLIQAGLPVPRELKRDESLAQLATITSQLLQAGANFQFNDVERVFSAFETIDNLKNHSQHISKLLFTAIEKGNHEQVHLLITTYPRLVNTKNEQNITPLNFAFQKKQDAIVAILLQQFEVKLNREIAALKIYGEQFKKTDEKEMIVQFAETLQKEAHHFFNDAPLTEKKCLAFQAHFLNLLTSKSKDLPKPSESLLSILKNIVSLLVAFISRALTFSEKISNNPYSFHSMKNKTTEKVERIEDVLNSGLMPTPSFVASETQDDLAPKKRGSDNDDNDDSVIYRGPN